MAESPPLALPVYQYYTVYELFSSNALQTFGCDTTTRQSTCQRQLLTARVPPQLQVHLAFRPDQVSRINRFTFDILRTALEYGSLCAQVNTSFSATCCGFTVLQTPDVDNNGHVLCMAEDCLQLIVYSLVATSGASSIMALRLPVIFLVCLFVAGRDEPF